ncbi:hypothetical protein BX616_000546 [Lobosporangium transversale]|uniref:Cytochrome b5-like heme/steroid binding domain-containing protein n=1 Tax=Lobosporangium transversale TaxID=64571 RepID=A0A1Y2GDG8_9FUNG|nr:cytochrome b5-like heme/steroid binding domain-containing protein [Lobosporangium transversale]KAF9907028.1 hypothetical protein BX616_000546 [Lobosporangium transversale]ORZ07769.1 cytochrome b5-like heme/steroid binding domain-containing protein [Lobosporangium transversale]|eukprot:XP_021878135.1 cytochrome b5-like heme/steroid binding domain-containing protein [Lobosporangium transversale]
MIYTTADLTKHNTKESLFLAMHGKVYDVTEFLDEHPGGEEVMLDEAGHDATDAFDDIGHSDEARELMAKYCIGELESDGSEPKPKPYRAPPKPKNVPAPADSSSKIQYVLALAVVAGCVVWKVLM